MLNHQDHTMQIFIQWLAVVILCIPRRQVYIVPHSIVLEEHIFGK
jgi:hypothetical protein